MDDLSAFSTKEADEIRSLMKSYEGAPGWPALPRRTAAITEAINHEGGFSVGLKPNILGAQGGGTTTVTFGLTLTSSLLLIKTVTEDSGGFTIDRGDETVLNVEEGVDFVGMCSYAASVSLATRFVGEVSLLGTGVTQSNALSESIEVAQGSNFFSIESGETVRTYQDLCLKLFRAKVRDSVVRDLKEIVRMSMTYDGAQPTDLKRALLAAIDGPEAKSLEIFGFTWNVQKARARQAGDAIIVDGTFAKKEPWYKLGRKDEVGYTYTYQGGREAEATVSEPDEEGWRSAANRLARVLAREVFLERSAKLQE